MPSNGVNPRHDAWGDSWGLAWGDAWGHVQVAAPSGGGGLRYIYDPGPQKARRPAVPADEDVSDLLEVARTLIVSGALL